MYDWITNLVNVIFFILNKHYFRRLFSTIRFIFTKYN